MKVRIFHLVALSAAVCFGTIKVSHWLFQGKANTISEPRYKVEYHSRQSPAEGRIAEPAPSDLSVVRVPDNPEPVLPEFSTEMALRESLTSPDPAVRLWASERIIETEDSANRKYDADMVNALQSEEEPEVLEAALSYFWHTEYPEFDVQIQSVLQRSDLSKDTLLYIAELLFDSDELTVAGSINPVETSPSFKNLDRLGKLQFWEEFEDLAAGKTRNR